MSTHEYPQILSIPQQSVPRNEIEMLPYRLSDERPAGSYTYRIIPAIEAARHDDNKNGASCSAQYSEVQNLHSMADGYQRVLEENANMKAELKKKSRLLEASMRANLEAREDLQTKKEALIEMQDEYSEQTHQIGDLKTDIFAQEIEIEKLKKELTDAKTRISNNERKRKASETRLKNANAALKQEVKMLKQILEKARVAEEARKEYEEMRGNYFKEGA
ncbi:hypothetical protein N0V90_005419 [Kalmusia sp. IMI 367209]|nr:hypothetical protein N0V90_005419 [Kalmusia sp. IMI 367209]